MTALKADLLLTYRDWIIDYIERTGDVLGKCRHAVAEMHAAFPELRIVKGHVYGMGWGNRSHWWLETADGTEIDPTAEQFPTQIVGYIEWEGPEPTGKYHNCGEYCYDGDFCCSDRCERAFRRSMFGG